MIHGLLCVLSMRTIVNKNNTLFTYLQELVKKNNTIHMRFTRFLPKDLKKLDMIPTTH